MNFVVPSTFAIETTLELESIVEPYVVDIPTLRILTTQDLLQRLRAQEFRYVNRLLAISPASLQTTYEQHVRTVSVRPVASTVTAQELQAYFRGGTVAFRLHREGSRVGLRTTVAYMTFPSIAEVKRALALSGKK